MTGDVSGNTFHPEAGGLLCLCLCAAGRAWDLNSPGMEVRTHLPPLTLCPPLSDTSPQCLTGLFSPVP